MVEEIIKWRREERGVRREEKGKRTNGWLRQKGKQSKVFYIEEAHRSPR